MNPMKNSFNLERQQSKNSKSLEYFRDSIEQMIVEDLKDPLTVVQTSLIFLLEEMNESGGYLTDKMKKVTQASLMQCHREMLLINDLLDFIHLDMGDFSIHKEGLYLPSAAAEALQSLDLQFKKHDILPSTHFEKHVDLVQADPVLIVRVITNLLAHSLRFTPKGGKIFVSVRQEEKNWIRVSVEDSGVAIPTISMEPYFESFRSGDPFGRIRRGAGFSLAFCRLVVEMHGGDIWVERGSVSTNVITFILPTPS